MTDRPIIFSAPMVRALLDGRKSQTRRVLTAGARWHSLAEPLDTDEDRAAFVRYAVGDRLWAREAWRAPLVWDRPPPREIPIGAPILYEADGHAPVWKDGQTPGKVRAAIHMPRWASRLTLTVTDVRVQRLREISEADAMAEGIVQTGILFRTEPGGFFSDPSAFYAYRRLWDDIHGPGAWDQNPWVAAISFETRKGNIDD